MAVEGESDEALMSRVSRGDADAFSCLVHRHTVRFHAMAWRMTGRGGGAEDIVQNCFLKIWEKPHMWDARQGARFTTWFSRMIINAAIDSSRRNARLRFVPPWDLEAACPSDPESSPDLVLAARRQAALLESAIQALPPRQKAALNLCVYEGMNVRAAADILGLREKATESLLMRAKARLRKTIGGGGQTP